MSKLLITEALREQLLIHECTNILEMIIEDEMRQVGDNEFEWDLTKDKIDKSKAWVKSKDQAVKYLTLLADKITSLPTKSKTKIMSYAVGSLIGLIGYNQMVDTVSNTTEPEVAKQVIAATPKQDTETVKSDSIAPTNFSNKLLDFIKYEEGDIKQKGEPVLKAYKLGDGKITIGWGHAESIGKSQFKVGQTISRALANKLLINDLQDAKNGVNRILNDWESKGIKFNITQGMYDAMVSMAYNMGVGGLRKSDFIQSVKSGDYAKAAKEILTTNVTMNGHISRRQKEAEMFLSK